MTQQTEALRLADAIEKAIRPEASLPLGDWARAAAELRRLHAENEALRNVANRGGHIAVAMSRIADLEAQRDALLEALKKMRIKYGEYACRVCDQADAAIKAVEETK